MSLRKDDDDAGFSPPFAVLEEPGLVQDRVIPMRARLDLPPPPPPAPPVPPPEEPTTPPPSRERRAGMDGGDRGGGVAMDWAPATPIPGRDMEETLLPSPSSGGGSDGGSAVDRAPVTPISRRQMEERPLSRGRPASNGGGSGGDVLDRTPVTPMPRRRVEEEVMVVEEVVDWGASAEPPAVPEPPAEPESPVEPTPPPPRQQSPPPPPPTPFLSSGLETPQESYDREEGLATTDFQKAALRQLRAWDEEVQGRFSVGQAVELVRVLCASHGPEAPSPAAPSKRESTRSFITCDCVVWAVIVILLVWVPLVVAATLARELKAQESGVLITASGGTPAATAVLAVHYSLADLQTMEEGTLRRIRDCTFVHRGAFHRIRVASLVRSASGDVHLVSPDRSTLKIEGRLTSAAGRATFARPFYGEQEVDLSQPADPRQPQGCSFAVMARAPERARPPR